MVNPTYIMSSTVEKLIENIRFPTILPIIGKPNYKTIAGVNANSASFQSNLGDGQLGLLFLTVSTAVYNTLSVTAFIPLINPGATAIITAVIIANENRSFTDATALFKQYYSANKSLKQMIIGAVDEMFVRTLQTKYVGYLNVSCRPPSKNSSKTFRFPPFCPSLKNPTTKPSPE